MVPFRGRIGNWVKIPDGPATVKRRLMHCHWETGKAHKVDESKSGDLPIT